ncbi:elongation factor G-like protein EF-G2 [Nakamurella lactea]|uniref:elongation factor G-like protein EF-G2 n=1 Tax=Nakamurella lactea TaxID=459515 RepID=UPI0004164342|nr:elongation factor G-like protein EF-G2 [Nakamurella lactea]
MSKGASRAEASPAPDPQSPDELRNVVLVGPGGAGKSTLYDALIAARVPGRRAAPETRPRSVGLSAAAIDSFGLTINLLDTPGYPDFIGELRAGLRAADAAVFVIAAADGIDGATALLWQELAGLGVPRAIAVSKLDLPRSDYDETIATCRRVFGDAQPLYLPLRNADRQVVGTLGLLSGRVFDSSSGERIERDPTGEEAAAIEGRRGELIEAIIEESEDASLLDRYLEGEQLSTDTVIDDLLTAVGKATFFPLVPISPAAGVGIEEIFEIIERCFPSPLTGSAPAAYRTSGVALDPITADPNGPLVAEVIRTTSDPYVGRLSLVRIFSGTLRSDETVHVSGHLGGFLGHEVEGHADHDADERVGPLSSPLDEQTRPKPRAIAGDLALVSGLSRAETSDTLSGTDRPILVEPWVLPEPLLPVAIQAANKRDEDKLAGALQRIVAEDVTMRMEQNPRTHQLVLWTMGQAHVDELLSRLADRYGVPVQAEPLRIALRETFIRKATVQGRHVKQSGGHGQYAVCQLEIEPLERGAGIEFVDKVVGGSVPRQFIPSVEKGARAQLDRGVLAGYPVVDVRVTLLDGKAHSVDSSDMAFQTAAAIALREAANASTVSLLEPVDTVDITVDDDHLGAVLSDLRGRRGHVLGTEPAGDLAADGGRAGTGRTVVHAEVPALELSRYAVDLRSVSRGTGTFSRALLRYDYLPTELAKAQLDGS